jgi:uncharacterized protein (DUF2336 family)
LFRQCGVLDLIWEALTRNIYLPLTMLAKEVSSLPKKARQLIKFETLLSIAASDRLGRKVVIMSEHAVSQGEALGTAPRSNNGVISAEQTVRKTVSAASFRKLTAFLKKAPNIPDMAPVIEAVEPVSVETVATPAPLDVIVAAPAETIVEPVIVAEVVPEISDAPVPPVEILQAQAPVIVIPEPQPAPVVAPLIVAQPEPEPAPEVVAPEAIVEPEIAAPVEVKPPSTILRRPPRDAFALPPSALTPKKQIAVTPVVQTPAQEQEAAELARSLLDMMASGASSGLPQERALAADTLLRMLPRLPLKSMVMLAERLCLMESPPHLLVAKLICDPRIEVAGPLLEECMHITDEDLALVINDGTTAKHRMMARRRRISRAITAQLIGTADPSVLLTVVRNVNAEIPHESFAELVHFAAEHHELLAPLCTRPDLPVPFAFELFWPAPAQLRRYLLSRFLTDSETLTKILKIALETNGDESASTAFPDPEIIKDALQMAADGRPDDAAAALANCAKISSATAARILNDKQGEPLAAFFKAVGVPRLVVSEILEALMRSSSGILDSSRDPDELQAVFDSLSFNKARILMTYWDWSALKTGPYAALN